MKQTLFALYQRCGYIPLRDFLLGKLGRSRAVVLYYHRIGGKDTLTRPTEAFRKDLEYLKRHCECVSLFELCERLKSDAPLSRPLAVVTFDDGYRDNFTHAVPELQRAGISATFYVATGYIGAEREFPHDHRQPLPEGRTAPVYPKLTWDDLREMQRQGFEIGSHTVNHIDCGIADPATLEYELTESLAALTRELGDRPRAFSYPWGKAQNRSAQALALAERLGYYSVAVTSGLANRRGGSVLHLERIDGGNGEFSELAFQARVCGLNWEPLRDRWLIRSQKKRK